MSTSNPWIVLAATIGLIALSAFFVVIEFAFLGARRHRLEEQAATSRPARAALKSVNELTLMLAGAQLGITLCTFALGAITKPAVDRWLAELFTGFGVPGAVSTTISFLLALLVVTFLHLVIGEMAPKSWAIAHPEFAARLVGPIARVYVWPLRPLLSWINHMANKLVAKSGVEPVDRAAVGGQDINTIRALVEHSSSAGALDAEESAQLTAVLELDKLTVRDLVGGGEPTAVPQDATIADVQRAAVESGHKRILIGPWDGSRRPRVLHVRDTLMEPADRRADELSREAFVLEADTPAYEALAATRGASEQLAAVLDDGSFIGVITQSDMVRRVLPVIQVGHEERVGNTTGTV